MKDTLAKYIQLRSSLLEEKKNLEARLAQIDEVLGGNFESQPRRGRKPGRPSKKQEVPPTGKPLRKGSIKAHVAEFLQKGPAKFDEIAAHLKETNVKFSPSSLRVMFYADKKTFRAKKGIVSLK